MNREIKFRLLLKATNQVSINSHTIQELASCEEVEWEFADGTSLSSNDFNQDEVEYLQCTNVFFSSTKCEVWEGDIVQDTRRDVKIDGKEAVFVYEVFYGKKTGEWLLKNKRSQSRKLAKTLCHQQFGESKVIGNIYENPELLTKETNV